MSLKYCITQMFQVLIYVCSYKSYDIKCPHISHWNLRAYHDCNDTSQYYCLFDENSCMYTEFCRRTPDFEGPGLKVVILGGLNGKMCSSNRYQPFMFWTNGSSECIFQKSVCSEEGQIIETDELTRKDISCRCDNTRGYSFVLQPKDITFCVPSQEDCSCYIEQCPAGHILNAGYLCTAGSLGHNRNTTSESHTHSNNKSTEMKFQPVNPEPGRKRFTYRTPIVTASVEIAGEV
ncbi:uncharacterized protein LOC127715961 [Mytilus californianus]|uniref:uncharacterized protein LOC127715961 n=1 Tax=Mytilus californianus TaxID=6549 RepID=UPI002248140F|nr:uncharacterized protein LOC127715961 [Mytilus californianus]